MLRSTLSVGSTRRRREGKTIAAMITLFCRDHHRSAGGPCADCAALAVYAQQRLERCPFQDDKPTCVKCPIHCYKPALRERVRQVMRYAGPRLLFRRPLLAIRHLLDERRPAPPRPRRQGAADPQRADPALDRS